MTSIGKHFSKRTNSLETTMKINGKVHCFFEQSGTFKNEFIKLGIPAEDYDIQNNFGQTDHVVDLFGEIEKAYEGRVNLFDTITHDDLILAFFPCIYFSDMSEILHTWGAYPNKDEKMATDMILERSRNRQQYYETACKMLATAKVRGLRLIMENPWNRHSYLQRCFVTPPTFVDRDRSLRGDVFGKPTAYWFINCKPTYGRSYQLRPKLRVKKDARPSKEVGMCSEERSMISPDYARNFICDFIIGKEQSFSERSLFSDWWEKIIGNMFGT